MELTEISVSEICLYFLDCPGAGRQQSYYFLDC